MGMWKPFSSGTSCPAPVPPNPNPFKYEVLDYEHHGNCSILLVKYEGCTTFNGLKLLLTRERYKEKREQSLDPHLLGFQHLVMARFEPTELGLAMARVCAEGLKKHLQENKKRLDKRL